MILPSPFGGRWLEEPDEGWVFEIAYERVIEVSLPLISPLRGQLQSPCQVPPTAVALRHAPAGAAPQGKP